MPLLPLSAAPSMPPASREGTSMTDRNDTLSPRGELSLHTEAPTRAGGIHGGHPFWAQAEHTSSSGVGAWVPQPGHSSPLLDAPTEARASWVVG